MYFSLFGMHDFNWISTHIKRSLTQKLSDKYLALLCVLIFAFIIRMRFFFIESIWNDETFYIWFVLRSLKEPAYFLSERVAASSAYSFLFVIAFFKLIIKDAVIAGRAAALAFNLVGIVLIYLLGAEIKDRATGLGAAILLSVHSIYWFIGSKVLLDAPLATAFIFAAYSLIKFEKERNYFWAMVLALSIIVCITSKLPGLIIIPIIGLYFFLNYVLRKKPIQSILSLFKRKDFWVFAGACLLFWLPIVVLNLKKFGSIAATSSGAISTATSLVTEWAPTQGVSYITSITALPIVLTIYLIPFFLLGIVFCLIYRKREHWLLLSFLSFYVIYTILTGGMQEPRYFLPAFPIMLLISAYAAFELREYLVLFLKKNINKFIFIFVIILLAVPLYQEGLQLNIAKADSYTGYREAGEWISENIPSDAMIFAGSPGFIRLFSGYEFIPNVYRGDDGAGKLYSTILYYGFPDDRPAFEKLILENYDKDIYAEIDMWEWKNQKWVYPLTQEKIEYFQSLGFQIVHIIERDIQTVAGEQKAPVILILKLDK